LHKISKTDPSDIGRNEVWLIHSDQLRLIATPTFSCSALHLFWMTLGSCDKLPRHRGHGVAAVGGVFLSGSIISRTPQI
jgi:hypothetical protein